MAEIFPGRYAAQTDEPFVVFLIGMRVNRLFALSSWIPVAKAMPPMLAELKRNPELGLLHFETLLYWRGVAVGVHRVDRQRDGRRRAFGRVCGSQHELD